MKTNILVKIDWSCAKSAMLSHDNVFRKYSPNLEIIDLNTKESDLIKMKRDDIVKIFILPQTYCTFQRINGSYCLNIIQKVKDNLTICKVCRMKIPSIKCLLGEPQCSEREAPRSSKCIKSGLYNSRCKVSRYHYVLLYPLDRDKVYLKVGIQRETTFPTRILEQSPFISVIYAITPNIWKGRIVESLSETYLEKLRGRRFQGIEIEHTSEKKKSLSKIETLIGFLRSFILPSSLDIFFNLPTSITIINKFINIGTMIGEYLSKEFSDFALRKPIIKNALEIFDFDKDCLKRASSIRILTIREKRIEISGKVVGWLGSYLLLENDEKIIVLDMRRTIGHPIEFSIKN